MPGSWGTPCRRGVRSRLEVGVLRGEKPGSSGLAPGRAAAAKRFSEFPSSART